MKNPKADTTSSVQTCNIYFVVSIYMFTSQLYDKMYVQGSAYSIFAVVILNSNNVI